MTSIAEQILEWRRAFDWSQEELAIRLDTSQAVISRWEDPSYDGHSLRSLRRLADAFGTTVTVSFDPAPQGWHSMDTAPTDGRAVLLVSAPQDIDMGPNGLVHHAPRVAIGHWHAEGTAWVDTLGRLDGDTYQLAVTGVWCSGGGWFQPNEVTHWRPLPAPPEESR